MQKKIWCCSGCGRIEFQLSVQDNDLITSSGDQESNVIELLHRDKDLSTSLSKYSTELKREIVNEYMVDSDSIQDNELDMCIVWLLADHDYIEE